MKKILLRISVIIFLALVLVAPSFASAQISPDCHRFVDGICYDESGNPLTGGNGSGSRDACTTGLTGVLCKLNTLLAQILPFLVSLGVIYFVWGMVQYFIADDEEAKKSGKDRIIYGIIGLAIIVSVWGLVTILVETLGVGQQQAYDVSQLVVSPDGADCKMGPKFQHLLNYATCIIGSSIIPFIFAIAVVMFVWGAVKFFIIDADEEAKREQGKQFMLWGIIALAVMVSIWGLVNILGETFDIKTNVLPQVGNKP